MQRIKGSYQGINLNGDEVFTYPFILDNKTMELSVISLENNQYDCSIRHKGVSYDKKHSFFDGLEAKKTMMDTLIFVSQEELNIIFDRIESI